MQAAWSLTAMRTPPSHRLLLSFGTDYFPQVGAHNPDSFDRAKSLLWKQYQEKDL